MFTCLACEHTVIKKRHVAREMMLGLGDEFEYIECAGCGCLQIATIPAALGRYYPESYPAHAAASLQSSGPLKRAAKHVWAAHHLLRPNLVGRLLTRIYGSLPFFTWVKDAGAGFQSSILDVGAGTGDLLQEMYSVGFSDLTGIDPLISRDLEYPGVRVYRRSLEEHSGQYDFILLNHSLEHIPDPLAALRQVCRLLKHGGSALVRTPVADSWAWRTYGVCWVQLDAPRHLAVHTRRGLHVMAARAGLEVVGSYDDSTAFQFWGSEQYQAGIPLVDSRSPWHGGKSQAFAPEQIQAWEAEAAQLNRNSDGDQICLFLRKPLPSEPTPT